MDDALFDKLEVVPSAQSDTNEVQTPTDDSQDNVEEEEVV